MLIACAVPLTQVDVGGKTGGIVMTCDVNGIGMEPTDAIREHVLRRMESALDQYHDRVGRVWVRLRDSNGVRGGRDLQCTVDVQLARGRKVMIREMSEDLYSAVSHAADRVKVAVGRQL